MKRKKINARPDKNGEIQPSVQIPNNCQPSTANG
jgi:hypothetical protein